MLPWTASHVADLVELMGPDFWPYGLAANRHTLETFLRYATGQALNPAGVGPDDLFAAETASTFAI